MKKRILINTISELKLSETKNIISNINLNLDDNKSDNKSDNSIIKISKKKLLTEDLGKQFEMAICLLKNISFDGSYKYDLDKPTKIKDKLTKFNDICDKNIKHTAKGGCKFDFTSEDNTLGLLDSTPKFESNTLGLLDSTPKFECNTLDLLDSTPKFESNTYHLSAKTSKKDGKVCPQVIGQPTKNKFCEYYNLDKNTSNDDIKKYIIKNIKPLLKDYFDNTFHCDTLYYNEKKDKIIYISKKNDIDWNDYNYNFTHLLNKKKWKESTTLKIEMDGNNTSLGEFQIHKKRSAIKYRWHFEKLLDIFKDNFNIIEIY